MRHPRLPPLDTTGYISCPIDTPLCDLDQKSPVPCIIVTPSSPTEYHIAFHHKSSPLKYASFSEAQQQQQQQQPQQQPRARRVLLTALNPFVETPPSAVPSFDMPPRRSLFKPRARTALVLAIPIFIIVCHILASTLLRSVGLAGSLFGGRLSHGGFSGSAVRMRTDRDAQLHPPLPPPPPPGPVSRHTPLDQVDPQLVSELDLD